jgi:DNA ligase-1
MTELQNFIDEMRGTSSATDKIAIISRSSAFIHNVLEYTYNPYKQYYATHKTCMKNSNKIYYDKHKDVFELLDSLSSREFTGHDAIALVNGYVANTAYGEIIYKIIDKDLDIRVGASIINKAVPGLIPTFNVALAQEYKGKCDWNDSWYASRKLDGVRCLAITDENGKCTLYSRMGKELTTLNKVKEAIEATNVINTVFDGEICLVDENGDEDFQGVMKQLRRKDHQIKNPVFMIFDMIYKKDFDKQKGDLVLSKRLRTLSSWCPEMNYDRDDNGELIHLNILRNTEQIIINGDDHLETWNTIAEANNWEGVMLRKNVGYEGKRTKNLLKVKKFHDAEYEVLGWDVDQHEVVRDGKSVSMTMLSQVWIEHKGYIVKVGSGFTQKQRLEYMDGSIVGKQITVQYFEETHNDKGGISLRFPTVKHIYETQRDC